MILKSRIRYVAARPVLGPLFNTLGARVLAASPVAAGMSRADVRAFVEALWRWRYSKLRVDPIEFLEEFGRIKLEMILAMSRHAAARFDVPLVDVPVRGRWEVKFEVRDQFTPGESTADARDHWAGTNVMFWNIVAGLKWEPHIFERKHLAGASVLDYGCNVGALAYLTRRHGARALTLVDVPGAALDFAGSFHADVATVLPVVSDLPPAGLERQRCQVAYCYHVLEHVPEPLAVARAIHQALETGGIFYVTFVSLPETVGGCNLKEAQSVRPQVLAFLKEAFEVVRWNEARVEYCLRKR